MIYGVDGLPSAVSTADIRDPIRAMAATKMLAARKSIVGSVVFFMLNALDSASKKNFHVARFDVAKVLRAVSCILHGYILDTAVLLRDVSPLAYVLVV